METPEDVDCRQDPQRVAAKQRVIKLFILCERCYESAPSGVLAPKSARQTGHLLL